MSEHPEAGTTRSGPLWQDDCLAPPAIPTGEKPADVLNVIWRKNEVFLDIGSWALGSAVMIIHGGLFVMLMAGILTGDFWIPNSNYWLLMLGLFGLPVLIQLYGLTKSVPPPVRFNRQRREVCVPQKDGSHWFVPWESVKAVGTAVSSVGQHGRATQGLLVVGFPNPQWNGKSEEDKEYSLALSCGGGTTAMAMWECIRTFMEGNPDEVPDKSHRLTRKKGVWAYYWEGIKEGAEKRDGLTALLWEGLCGLFVFNTPLIDFLERKKLSPPPDLTDPTVVEWSKPLPPDQWTRRSAELERAIQAREADLRERSSQ
ncbi:hypothetical protein ACFELC_05575 [Pseudomonas aeruginosa]|uniref:hypothetical protein n=1 Tax=Pseudomonas aeruginosa TaxID=287 RepID=UPI003839E4C2